VRAFVKVALGCAAAVVVAAPADALPARARNACALLKTSEIDKEFGPDVAKPTRGPGPACNWELGTAPGASGSGTIGTFLLRTQAKVAFDVGRDTDSRTTDVDGLGKDAYYSPSTGTVWVLKDSRTVFYVQGVIVGENVGRGEDVAPDLEDRLVRLAKKAEKRA
jgi:hypothetical protein